MAQKKIEYPYLPEGHIIKYVGEENSYMQMAKKIAMLKSLDKAQPTASIIVNSGKVIGSGANGSDYHLYNECERVKRKIPTGQGYEYCEGCHPKNHSEQKAINDAMGNGKNLGGALLYLWGHWWCCESCWDAIIKAGVAEVYLLEGSEEFFNKAHSTNP